MDPGSATAPGAAPPPIRARAGRVTDDRGRGVRVLDPAGFAAWPTESDPRIGDLLARVGAAVHRSSTRWTMWVVTIGVMGLAMLLSWRLFVLAPAVPRYVWFGVCVVAGSIAMNGVMRLVVRGAARDIAALLLEEGLCPTCGYNFFDLPAETDGCYVCPECGGAWRADRVRRCAPFAGEGDGSVLGTIRSAAQRTSRPIAADDRGRPVALVQPRLRRERRNAADEDHRSRITRARRRIARIGRSARWLTGGFLLALCALMFWFFWFGPTPPMPAGASFGAIVGCFLMGGLGISTLLGNFAYRAGPMIEAMKVQGLCPSCARVLDEVPAASDGCTVCPDCHAAWRMPR